MASISEYQHKKFDLKSDSYTHKKFGLHMKKRKLENIEDMENMATITAQTILEAAKTQQDQQKPPAKRRQTKALFRPWLDEDNKKSSKSENTVPQQTSVPSEILATIPTNIMSYRPNMIRQFPAKQRSEKEQQRRNRNTLACLINRRNQQAEQLLLQQQYAAYQQHQADMREQSVRSALYLRHLLLLALQRQQQLFVFGKQ